MNDNPNDIDIERHYTPAQIAERLCLCTETVTKMLKNEPGVFRIGHEGLNRTRVTLRVPESVWKRIQEKFTIKADDGQHKKSRRYSRNG